MSADYTISELSADKMVLQKVMSERKVTFNFVTPNAWRKGDSIAILLNRAPYNISFDDDGKMVVEIPEEPPNGWEREFYKIINARTKDFVTVDFDSVEGFEKLAAQAKQKRTK